MGEFFLWWNVGRTEIKVKNSFGQYSVIICMGSSKATNLKLFHHASAILISFITS